MLINLDALEHVDATQLLLGFKRGQSYCYIPTISAARFSILSLVPLMNSTSVSDVISADSSVETTDKASINEH